MMNYQNELRALIENNRNALEMGEFGNGISDEWIKKAEMRLSVTFPPLYKWWLANYGGGEIHGNEIFSVYELDFDSVVGGDIVYINELNQKNGLSNKDQLVIMENDMGETYYFDLTRPDNHGEYPVYCDLSEDQYARNFFDFFQKQLL